MTSPTSLLAHAFPGARAPERITLLPRESIPKWETNATPFFYLNKQNLLFHVSTYEPLYHKTLNYISCTLSNTHPEKARVSLA